MNSVENNNIYIPQEEKENRANKIFEGLSRFKDIDKLAQEKRRNKTGQPTPQQNNSGYNSQSVTQNNNSSMFDEISQHSGGGYNGQPTPQNNNNSMFDEISQHNGGYKPVQPMFLKQNSKNMSVDEKFEKLKKMGMDEAILESFKKNPPTPKSQNSGPSVTDFFNTEQIKRQKQLMGNENNPNQYQQNVTHSHQQNINESPQQPPIMNELVNYGLEKMIDESLKRILPDVLKQVLTENDVKSDLHEKIMNKEVHFKINDVLYSGVIKKSTRIKKNE